MYLFSFIPLDYFKLNEDSIDKRFFEMDCYSPDIPVTFNKLLNSEVAMLLVSAKLE